MKNVKLILLAAPACALALCACSRGARLQNVRGEVVSVELRHDTLAAMRVAAGGDTLLFSLSEARLTSGLAMQGDSVSVHYTAAGGDTLRAFVVAVLPATRQEVPAGTLLTLPAGDATE